MNWLVFLNPAGFYALTSVLLVTAAYFFYRRYRPQKVTGLFLWGDPARSNAGGRHIETPVWSWPLVLDLLAAICFSLALTNPSLRLTKPQEYCIILDNSLSMQAQDNYKRSQDICRKIISNADNANLTVILAGVSPSLLVTAEHTPSQALQRLASYYPVELAADFTAALTLAKDLNLLQADLHLITDQSLAQLKPVTDINPSYHLLPGRGDNLSLAHLTRSPHQQNSDGQTSESIFVSLRSYATQEQFLTVTIRDASALFPSPAIIQEQVKSVKTDSNAGITLDLTNWEETIIKLSEQPQLTKTELENLPLLTEQTLTIAPDAIESLDLQISPASHSIYIVYLDSSADILSLDSIAFIPPALDIKISYQLDIPDTIKNYYTRGLQAAGAIPWRGESTQQADIVVTEHSNIAGQVLTLELLPEKESASLSPPFVVDTSSPLCRDLHLQLLWWVAAQGNAESIFSNLPGEQTRERQFIPLVSSGELPLYWQGGVKRWYLNLLVEKSNLPKRSAWPVLFSNLVSHAELLRPGLKQNQLQLGGLVPFTAGGIGQSQMLELWAVSDKKLAKLAAFPDYTAMALPTITGVYYLVVPESDFAVYPLSVVCLAQDEMDLRQLNNREIVQAPDYRLLHKQTGYLNIAALFLGLGLLFLIINWCQCLQKTT